MTPSPAEIIDVLLNGSFADYMQLVFPLGPSLEPSTNALRVLRESMEKQYQAACPAIPKEQIAALINRAFLESEERFSELTAHAPAMVKLAEGILPSFPAISPEDYLEILYIAATQADFVACRRVQVRECAPNLGDEGVAMTTDYLIDTSEEN